VALAAAVFAIAGLLADTILDVDPTVAAEVAVLTGAAKIPLSAVVAQPATEAPSNRIAVMALMALIEFCLMRNTPIQDMFLILSS
jgi:hypothetical protein